MEAVSPRQGWADLDKILVDILTGQSYEAWTLQLQLEIQDACDGV